MIGLRAFSFVVLLGIFLTAILWKGLPGQIAFVTFAAALAWGGVWEFLGLIEQIGRKSFRKTTAWIGCLTVITVFLSFHIGCLNMMFFGVASLIAVAGWFSILFSHNSREYLEKLLNSVSAVFMVILPLLPLIFMYNINSEKVSGPLLLLYLILVTKSGDTGAYLTGTLSSKLMKGNNHKIVPSISPKKSWEGTIGGLILSMAVSMVLWREMLQLSGTVVPLAIGSVLFIGGFAGDLAESVLKRIAGVKDSGKIFPGMGGVLDVVDSLILNVPLFFFFFMKLIYPV